MKSTIALFAALAVTTTFAGTDWWVIPTSDFTHLEEMNAYNMFTLGAKTGTLASYQIRNTDGVNPCRCTQLNLTPPVGKEGRWLSIILSALATGQPLVVYGNCSDTPNGILDVDAKQSTGRLTLGN